MTSVEEAWYKYMDANITVRQSQSMLIAPAFFAGWEAKEEAAKKKAAVLGVEGGGK